MIDTIKHLFHDMISSGVVPSEAEIEAFRPKLEAQLEALSEDEREQVSAQLYQMVAHEMLGGMKAKLGNDMDHTLQILQSHSDVELSIDEVLALGLWWVLKGSKVPREARLAEEFGKIRNGLMITMPRFVRENGNQTNPTFGEWLQGKMKEPLLGG